VKAIREHPPITEILHNGDMFDRDTPGPRSDPPTGAAAVVDLNADLGEEVTDDAGLLAVVTSANVACGYHAGNPAIMRTVCAQAAELGVSVGAQVSYADRENFGRAPHDVAFEVLREQVADQVGVLAAIAAGEGTAIRYLKPHGALYHRVRADEEQARAVLAGAPGLPVLGLPGAALLRLAAQEDRVTWVEGFPDRGYTADGGLVPRDQPGAVITDPLRIAARAVELARTVDSVCVHGDHPGAVAHAVAVRRALERAGYLLRGL
jgi:5-oxoprolinase (ATP-hydrolysing) subunit A